MELLVDRVRRHDARAAATASHDRALVVVVPQHRKHVVADAAVSGAGDHQTVVVVQVVLQHVQIEVRVHVQDVHLGNVALEHLQVKLALRRVLAAGHVVQVDVLLLHEAQRTHVAAAEGVHLEGVDLRHVARRVQLLIHHHQRAQSLRFLGSGRHDGVQEIQTTVGADRCRGTHRSREDHGLVGVKNQMAEEGALFQRVRAVGHDDAVDVVLVQVVLRLLGERDPVADLHILGRLLENALGHAVGDGKHLGRAADQIVHVHGSGLVDGCIRRALSLAGNGAARSKNDHVRKAGIQLCIREHREGARIPEEGGVLNVRI